MTCWSGNLAVGDAPPIVSLVIGLASLAQVVLQELFDSAEHILASDSKPGYVSPVEFRNAGLSL